MKKGLSIISIILLMLIVWVITFVDYDERVISDDTEMLQGMIDSNDYVSIPEGTYWVDARIGLRPRSNQRIVMTPNTYIKVIPNSSSFYAVFYLENVENVKIIGGKLEGDRYEHHDHDGSWGFGVLISSHTRHITIEDMAAYSFWGDGFYVGGDTDEPPTDILFDNVVADNNRRQGLSITQAVDVVVKNSAFMNTNGEAPEAGIDIEPNTGDFIEGIHIENVRCKGNKGSGIDLLGYQGSIEAVRIIDSTIEENYTGLMISEGSDIEIESTTFTKNEYRGIDIKRDVRNVSVNRSLIEHNGQQGIAIITSNQIDGVYNILIEDCDIIANSQAKQYEFDGIRIGKYDETGILEQVRIYNSRIGENHRYGVTVGQEYPSDNIVVEDCDIYAVGIGETWGLYNK